MMQQGTLSGCRARVSTGSFARTRTVKAHATLLSRPPRYVWILCILTDVAGPQGAAFAHWEFPSLLCCLVL
jgi:hypothetical protein